EANKCIADTESIILKEIPGIIGKNRDQTRILEEMKEATGVLESTNWNIYEKPDWISEMRQQTRFFCCEVHAGTDPSNRGMYKRLIHDGGGAVESYRNNTSGLERGVG